MDDSVPGETPHVPESSECDGGNGADCDGRGGCKTQRRKLLAAISGAAAAGTAGCIGLFEEPAHLQETEEPTNGAAEDDGEGAGTGADDGTGYDIEFLKEEETISVAEDEELLYAGLDQGWDLPYQCEVGVCGQCTAKVDGDGHELVEMTDNQYLDDDEIEEGYVLTCTGQPREEFAVETDVHPDDEDDTDEEDETEEGEQYDIEFLKEGETIPVAEDEELLYAGLDQGWDLPYQCEVGVCGQCTAKVDGDGHELVEMTDNQYLDDDEIEEGYVLTCTGQPREEFAVETDEHP